MAGGAPHEDDEDTHDAEALNEDGGDEHNEGDADGEFEGSGYHDDGPVKEGRQTPTLEECVAMFHALRPDQKAVVLIAVMVMDEMSREGGE